MINRDGAKNIIRVGSVIVVILLIIGYALFESHSLIKGPDITISEPIPGSSISTSSVNIIGKASRIQDISLNGRPILVDKDGNFNETILLASGYNASLFSAKDKFNRTIEYKLELVYEK